MQSNSCNVNHLDADALLPPRKRLLAGLKRQNSDVNSPVPSPSNPSSAVRETDVCVNVYTLQLSNPNLSNEEIVEASRIAAMEAAKAAEAARANAEEKAAKAAKAVAAAKNALELVATLSEETVNKENFPKKNKMKKHVTVEALYNKNRGTTDCRTDEELARKLHRVINSSPRILKNSSGSDSKNHKHKRLKGSAFSGSSSACVGVPVGKANQPSSARSSGKGIVEDVGGEGCINKIDMIMVELNASKADKGDQLKLDDRDEWWVPSKTDRQKLDKSEMEALQSKDEFAESLDSFGKKRGRIKQKKLPLSICSFRDQSGPKEEAKTHGMSRLEDNTVKNCSGQSDLVFNGTFSGSTLTPVERTSLWKCQSFKAPPCVKQNKVMQS